MDNFKKCVICILVLIALVLFVGCGGQSTNNISELRKGMYAYEDNLAYYTFYFGQREKPYKLDGKSEEKVDYGILCVVFNEKPQQTEIEFSLTINDVVYSSTLEKSPFSNEYMCDIGVNSFENANVSVELSLENFQSVSLQCLSSDWKIDYDKALKIATAEFKEEIKALEKDNKPYESYLKIIYEPNAKIKTYFWQFTFITESGEKHFCTISTVSGEVLVKN